MSIRVFSVAELLTMPKPQWLVEQYLPERGFLTIYGAPGDGKTFVALDLALCVATGTPWHGHAVRKSYVLYVSAEGGGGIGIRVGAWLHAHGVQPADYSSVLASFVLSTISVHPDSPDLASIIDDTLHSPDYQAELAAYLDDDEPPPPPFIVIDTLARCIIGNENQQEDMGAFVRALDELRERHEATTLVLHHTGKDGGSERGSTVLRGACDTMLKVDKSGDIVTVSCDKQKDAEPFEEVEFSLTSVPEWDSCVLELHTDVERRTIAAYQAEHPQATVRDIAQALGMSKSTVHRRLEKTE